MMDTNAEQNDPGSESETMTQVVRAAQCRSLLNGGGISLLANALASLSVVILQAVIAGASGALAAWWMANMIAVALRYSLLCYLRRQPDTPAQTVQSLRMMTAGAFAGGIFWGALPLFGSGLDAFGAQSFLYVIVAGAATGAMARGTPYLPIAVAFPGPPLISITLLLLLHGGLAANLLGANMLLLGLLLVRSCRTGAKSFADDVISKAQATSLALSLSKANDDISASNQQLELLANRDPLTELANRGKFNIWLNDALDAAASTGSVALLLLNIDRFRAVNDRMGHDDGDRALVELAIRLTRCAGPHALVARLDGDEFAILISEVNGVAATDALAQRCLEEINVPMMLAGRDISVTASIGLARFPSYASTANDLLACAETALAQAREQGGNQVKVFDSVMQGHVDRRRRLERDIAGALADGTVKAWFQPQFRISDSHIIGFEALVRWHHHDLGHISAPEVVAAAQAMRQREQLARTMAEQACILVNWLAVNGLGSYTVAINISPQDFAHFSISRMLREVLDRHAVDPGCLEVEITEDTLIDPDLVASDLLEIAAMGIKLAIDDFGMGHTSLSYLTSMQLDRVKIDRMFVNNISDSVGNQALVTAMVAMGRMLGVNVLVEGVETTADLDMLRLLGCQSAQGYLFGRPMPPEDIMSWFESNQATTLLQANSRIAARY